MQRCINCLTLMCCMVPRGSCVKGVFRRSCNTAFAKTTGHLELDTHCSIPHRHQNCTTLGMGRGYLLPVSRHHHQPSQYAPQLLYRDPCPWRLNGQAKFWTVHRLPLRAASCCTIRTVRHPGISPVLGLNDVTLPSCSSVPAHSHTGQAGTDCCSSLASLHGLCCLAVISQYCCRLQREKRPPM